jgi:phosphonate transport system substrate-binding protein
MKTWKTTRLGSVASWIAAFSLAALTGALSLGGECPRGDLDSRYCDRDGDLVADPPSDASRQVDPRILVFAYTPVEDPAVYRTVWREFLDHLAEKTGKRVQFFPVQSNAAQIEAMRAGRLHVAGFNTGSVPFAVNVAGFVPLVMMASNNGDFGYEMEILVKAGSPVRSVEQLRGKKIAFTSPTSNSGYKAPVAILQDRFGLVSGTDFEGVFSGKHDNSILGVVHDDYDAAAVANSVLRQMIRRGVVKDGAVRSLYTSESFPTTAYGIAHDLNPELAGAIRDAFLTFQWEGSGLQKEFAETEGETFVPVSYREHWEIIRRIDRASGVDYRTSKP